MKRVAAGAMPHDYAAEDIAIGSMLMSRRYAQICMERLDESDFSRKSRRAMFSTARRLAAENPAQAGPVQLRDALRETGGAGDDTADQLAIITAVQHAAEDELELENAISSLRRCSASRQVANACAAAIGSLSSGPDGLELAMRNVAEAIASAREHVA